MTDLTETNSTKKGLRKYKKGNLPLREISEEFGVTYQQIHNTEKEGIRKMKILLDQDEEILEREIEKARGQMAEDFSRLLAKATTADDFFGLLYRNRLLTRWYKPKQQEKDAFMLLKAMYNTEQVHMMLLTDIEEDNNLFKAFQEAVSRKVFLNR